MQTYQLIKLMYMVKVALPIWKLTDEYYQKGSASDGTPCCNCTLSLVLDVSANIVRNFASLEDFHFWSP